MSFSKKNKRNFIKWDLIRLARWNEWLSFFEQSRNQELNHSLKKEFNMDWNLRQVARFHNKDVYIVEILLKNNANKIHGLYGACKSGRLSQVKAWIEYCEPLHWKDLAFCLPAALKSGDRDLQFFLMQRLKLPLGLRDPQLEQIVSIHACMKACAHAGNIRDLTLLKNNPSFLKDEWISYSGLLGSIYNTSEFLGMEFWKPSFKPHASELAGIAIYKNNWKAFEWLQKHVEKDRKLLCRIIYWYIRYIAETSDKTKFYQLCKFFEDTKTLPWNLQSDLSYFQEVEGFRFLFYEENLPFIPKKLFTLLIQFVFQLNIETGNSEKISLSQIESIVSKIN